MKILISFILLAFIQLSSYSQITTDSLIKSKSEDLLINKHKNPSVFVEEISNQNPSVVEVETAIPSFIGYTQIAKKKNDNDLLLKPTKIFSMLEYEKYFGFPQERTSVSVSDNAAGNGFSVNSYIEPELKYLLYYSLKMFFDNGGSKCYIVSVGNYLSSPVFDLRGNTGSVSSSMYGLQDGLDKVAQEDEPTLIVIPESINLSENDYQTLVQSVLSQCNTLHDRFGIFDLYDSNLNPNSIDLNKNRGYFGYTGLKYGAVYYPSLKTSLTALDTNVDVTYKGSTTTLHDYYNLNRSLYNFIKNKVKEHPIKLPPSGAVAGAYAITDRNRGVWKAPANISLLDVVEPLFQINNSLQESMNIDVSSGKSINVIRTFAGKGTLIWGSRTLAGNDNEWRYIPVRRFFIMVEESVKKSTQWVVFEPNNANTWTKVRAEIENYLTKKWRDGALVGSKPQDAFFVKCGLGQTMTNLDIIEGKMNIEIGMAVTRPAEFIILKLSHKMQ